MPELFFKPGQCLANPGEEVPVPRCAQNNEVDYEVELAIVIGRPCRNVTASEATQYILGWTCANDITARELQKQCSQWGFSKGMCVASVTSTTNVQRWMVWTTQQPDRSTPTSSSLTIGFDKFCPLGPVLVSAAALPDPHDVTLQTRVNGQLVQSGSAKNMIWHVSE